VLSSFNQVRLSANGRLAVLPVMDRSRGVLDLWTVEIATGAARRVSTPPAAHNSPVFSPNAKRIAFGKAYGRPPVLAMLALDEGEVAQGLPEGLPEGDIQFPTDWSPDGRFIAETSVPRSNRGRNTGIYLVDLARKSELVPLLVGARQAEGAVFAPDGRSIAFVANDSGHQEVYVQRFNPETRRLTGTPRQISHGDAYLVRWPKPGRELFYLGRDYWVYATTLTGEPERLFQVPPQAISRLHPPFSFDVTAGGNRFLLPAYRGERPSTLAVALNWENLVASNSGP
jgi:Tol biopolymer transport system component